MSVHPSHDELMRMHELAALRDERDALKEENERLREMYENVVGNRSRFGFTINHLLECDEALRTVEQRAAELEQAADLLDALRHPERYLPAEEIAEYKRCQQSVIDARRSAERNEGQRYIG